MRFVFIDDSARTTHAVPRAGLGPLHAYGAVIVPEESLVPYAERLSALRTRLGLPPKTEFKWNPGNGPLHRN